MKKSWLQSLRDLRVRDLKVHKELALRGLVVQRVPKDLRVMRVLVLKEQRDLKGQKDLKEQRDQKEQRSPRSRRGRNLLLSTSMTILKK